MLTHQIIRVEIEELKRLLIHGDLEIPSFWRCIWPGLILMPWFLLSSYFSYWQSDYVSGLDKITAMAFSGVMSFFSIIVIANARSLFLSLPKSFREKSRFYNHLSAKCKFYGVFILFLFPCMAFYFASVHLNAIVFCAVTFASTILTVMVMNIDLRRYQWATLISVLKSARNKESQ